MRSASPRALLTTAAIAVALAAADTYVVVLALTDMMAGVGIGIDALQKATPIISGFLLGYIAVLPLVGRLADLVSRQKVLLACLAIFVIGSAITALAVELPVLVAGRVIQGAGGGGLVPATLALVADLWPADRRGVPLGVVGAVQELGSVLGPVLGALVLAVWDWRAIFWLNAVLGVVLAGFVLVAGNARLRRPRVLPSLVGLLAAVAGTLALAAPEALTSSIELGLPFVPFGDSSSRLWTPIGLVTLSLFAVLLVLTAPRWWPILRRADLPGAVLLGGALGCVVLTFAAADPATEVVGPLGLALLPAGAVLLGLYLWRHRVAAEPLVPRGTLRGRAPYALVVSALLGVALVAVVVDIPVLARLTLTDSQTSAALVLVRFLVAVPVGALLGGLLLRRFGDGLVTAAGLGPCAAGLGVMGTWGPGSLAGIGSYVVLVLVGLGVGLPLAPINNVVLADAPPAGHGTASAMVVIARMIGMVAGLALLTAVGLHRYYAAVAQLPDQTDGDALLAAGIVQVQSVFIGAAIAAAVGAVVAFSFGVRRRAGLQV
ncbi:MFS transporter [Epidermidibacterium keratini]|uniref:MFS transporter n=1 Tax=Epidermidibacterium keratini TaxID=1891644 RepID=A0A7L4YNS6_9ACTN|nr:MFS transporter [Epidermidibacterium keratini]QHC00459.1 MFS transporter [Epidermidibacterium keratini]